MENTLNTDFYTYEDDVLYLNDGCGIVEYQTAIEKLLEKNTFPVKVFLTKSNYIKIFKELRENNLTSGIINPYFKGKQTLYFLLYGSKRVYILTAPENDDTLLY